MNRFPFNQLSGQLIIFLQQDIVGTQREPGGGLSLIPFLGSFCLLVERHEEILSLCSGVGVKLDPRAFVCEICPASCYLRRVRHGSEAWSDIQWDLTSSLIVARTQIDRIIPRNKFALLRFAQALHGGLGKWYIPRFTIQRRPYWFNWWFSRWKRNKRIQVGSQLLGCSMSCEPKKALHFTHS